ncbi:MAG: serine hydrolase [Gemmatimonadetes bacterium]|nr:serine hydrolase [Gemmatimonadota bacterium]
MVARMERVGVPDAVVAIVREGRVIHMRGYGRADDSGRPVTPATPFTLGRRLRRWRRSGTAPASGWRTWGLQVALPSLLLLGLAWLVLFAVPAAYDASLSAARLFAPDLWWLMIAGGGSAVLWAAIRPVLVGRALGDRTT